MAIQRARRLAGMGAVQFEELLRDRLHGEGMELADGALADWEAGLTSPSAIVLLAAADVARVELELLFCRGPLLARVQDLEEQVGRQSAQLRDLRWRVS
jgi:transcriptional regulator with XRE-family HTH domain